MKYKKKLFAFMDVLGFSTIVKHSENNIFGQDKIELFYSICAENPNWYRQIPGMQNIQFMVMSDSIVAALDFEGRLSYETFKAFALAIGRLQNELAWADIWVRGAIVVGDIDFRLDQNFVVGPALVKAANLEKNYAIYPRIIIDPQILNEFKLDSFFEFRTAINACGIASKIIFEWMHPLHLPSDSKLPKDVPLFLDFFALNDLDSPRSKGIVTHVTLNLKKELAHYPKYRWLADYLLDSARLRYVGHHPQITEMEKYLL